MHKLYESIIEIVGWIKIALSPTLIGAGLGWIVYYNIPTTTGIIIAALLLLSGIVVGSVWATRVWNRQGTNSFLASIMATPDIDEAIRKNELPETSEYYNTFNDDWNDAIAYVHTHEHCADIQWK